MSHLNSQETRREPDKGIGGAYHLILEPFKMTKLWIGPFDSKESPEFKVSEKGVNPPGSFICQQDRLEQDNGSLILFLMQNYGIREVEVTIKRTA